MIKRFCIFVVAMIIANQGFADDASPLQKHAALIKNVRLPGDDFSSFAFDMRMTPGPVQLLVQVRYQRPNDYALNVFDGNDLTPVLVVRGQRAMVNDPLQQKISLIASAGVAFDLSPQDDQLNANFAVNLPGEGQINNRIQLDFAALFSKVNEEISEKIAATGSVEISGKTEKQSTCLASFLPTADFPLQQLQMSVESLPDPVLTFSNIVANRKIATDAFVFPLQQLKDTKVEFIEASSDGMLDSMMVVAAVMKAIFTRAALRSPDLRQEIEARLQIKPDWSGIEATDRERSEKLKAVFRPYNQQ
jgi:hypothetical protein